MFAVPGWSVSPALLKQQRDDKSSARKAGPAVTPENVGSLWREKVDKIKPSPANDPAAAEKSPAQPESKKRKLHGQEKSAAARPQPAPQDHARATTHGDKSSLKPRKRQKVDSKDRKKSATDDRSLPVQTAAVRNALPLPAGPSAQPTIALTPMQDSMRRKLASARFRHLNQTLYTSPSSEARQLFEANASMFDEYHQGFRQQVSAWPENPVDTFVRELKARGKQSHIKNKKKQPLKAHPGPGDAAPLPRTKDICTVADLGCGDAALATEVAKFSHKSKIRVLSYDLHSPNSHVTKADIAKLPLENGTVDIAILCLALMGTNWIEFVEEAWRVLHWKGELWIAEIKSRFGAPRTKAMRPDAAQKPTKSKLGAMRKQDKEEEMLAEEQLMVEVDGVERKGPETDITAFVQVLRRRGFSLQSEAAVDASNKMFVRIKFVKNLSPSKGKNAKQHGDGSVQPGPRRAVQRGQDDDEVDSGDEARVLKPCLYKQR